MEGDYSWILNEIVILIIKSQGNVYWTKIINTRIIISINGASIIFTWNSIYDAKLL